MIVEFNEVKIEVFIPEDYIIKLRDELNNVNACKIGNYDNVLSITKVRGYWRPLEGSTPFNGEIGQINEVAECKIEIRCKSEYINDAIEVIKKNHPYEEPIYNIIPIINDLFE